MKINLSYKRNKALFFVLLSILMVFLGISTQNAYTAATNYTDPGSYPLAWPASLNSTTALGLNMQDNPTTGMRDDSTGGTNPNGNVDFSGTGTNAASFFSGDGSTMFIRYRLNGDPTTDSGSGQPYISASWNFLMDSTGDGFWDFSVSLVGMDSGPAPDDLYVYYNKPSASKTQLFGGNASLIWKQDSAKHNTTPNNTDGEPGSFSNWTRPCTITPTPTVCYDLGRTRVSSVPGSTSDYFLDIQVPVSSLDATSLGGPSVTSTTKFGFAASTSNSNTDPTQKDFLYNGAFSFCSTCPFPTSDQIDPSGNVYTSPTVTSVTSTACPTNPITLTAQVNDTLIVNSTTGFVEDTIATVAFSYYYDSNSNGLADDGKSWVFIANGTTSPFSSTNNNLGKFTTAWNTSSLPNGNYLIKVVATDDQNNATDSYNQTNPGRMIAVFSGTCGLNPDAGDAPDTYKTTIASGGALHYSPTTTLKIGVNNTDTETDGPTSGNGTNDDTAGTDDEDSVTVPLTNAIYTNASTYTLSIPVTNTTGSSANLRGWIDFDGKNGFDDNEASDLKTISSSGSSTLTWTIPSGAVSGSSYLRLRITPDTLDVTDDIGNKNGGEVEDYPITILAPPTVELISTFTPSTPPTSALLDEAITYTIRVVNRGPDTATNTTLTDSLPASLKLLSVSCTSTGTASCGTNATSGNNISFTGSSINPSADDSNRLDITIVARAISTGSITNSFTATKAAVFTETNTTNNTVSATTNVSNQTSFTSCPTTGFFSYTSGTGTALSSIDLSTGTKITIGTAASFLYNAIGFNTNDNYLYGLRNLGGTMRGVRIGANNTVTDLGPITSTATGNPLAGFVTGNELIFYTDSASKLYRLNIDRTSPSFMTVTSEISITLPSGVTSIGDLSLNPNDSGFAYAIGQSGQVLRVNITSGAITTINPNVTGQGLPASSFGSTFFGASGTLYTINDSTNQLYGLTFNSAKTSYIITSIGNTGTAASGTDGARCNTIADPVDLQITKTTTTSTVITPSGVGQFVLEVINNGPYAVSGITIADNVPSNLTNVSWTCSPSGNSTCGTSSGSGTNNISFTSGFIGVGSANKLTITVSGTATTKGSVTNTASITVPSFYSDSNSANNSSQSSMSILSPVNISGTIFEDINYGGGAGRNLTSSSGVGVPSATVELYSVASGVATYISSTTTGTTAPNIGKYTFANRNPGNYLVRVVNSTVTSTRPGTVNTLRSVQTFRTNASTGTVVDVTDYVGGQNPQVVDANAGIAGATINTSTSLFTAGTGLTGNTAQSITNVNVIGTSDITGVDFGFNFDTIVNTNSSGQGSLDQFIINSNTLTNSGLSQVGQTAGREVSIFMIPNGVANLGQNTTYANQLSTYGAAKITITSFTVTDANTSIDGRTQTKNVRAASGQETNSGQIGSGGFVGVSQTRLNRFDNPEIELIGNNTANANKYIATGTGFEIRNTSIVKQAIVVSGNNSLVQDNVIGMQANGTELDSTYSAYYCLEVGGGSDLVTVRHNYVKCNNSGIRRDNSGSNMLVEYNEVDRPLSGHTATYEAFLIIGAGTNDTAQYNLFKNMRGAGSELGYNPASNVVGLKILENTYIDNGKENVGSNVPSSEPLGIIVKTIGSGSLIRIERNIIANNGATGILVQDTNNVWITKNSIFNNGPGLTQSSNTNASLGIDLGNGVFDPNSMVIPTNLDGVTPNDGALLSTTSNNGTDYPIITSALIKGSTMKVQGYVGNAPSQTAFANTILEFFLADDDGNNKGQIFAGDNKSVAHGEGKIYLDTCNTNTTNGSFNCTFYNIRNVTPGTFLTATATRNPTLTQYETSEFSNLTVVQEQDFLFYPDNAMNALPGDTVSYAHELIASEPGNIQLNSVSNKGWVYTFFKDVNGNSLLDAGDTPYTGGMNPSLGDVYSSNSTHSVKIITQVFIPSNSPMNTVDSLIITATLTPTDTSLSPKTLSVTDLTTVSNQQSGALKLIKSVDKSSAKPNENIVYTIICTNTGNSPLNSIKIEDQIPANTTFVAASFGGGSSGTITNPSVGGTGKITWSLSGVLTPSSSATVTFTVKVNP